MKKLNIFKILFFFVWLWVTATVPAAARELPYDLNLDVQQFELDNGMLFLVVHRPATPQVAVRLAIRAGSALEEAGKTGIAHMLEHMMFKGTKNFGTLDFSRDQALQEKIEAAYQVVLAEQRKREPDQDLIDRKRAEMEKLRLEVQKIFVPQAFSAQLGKNGAVGVNAFTTKDQTQYMASVPADMLEQWFSIASEQIFEPAWREFYVEREVIQREWAFRYVNDANGAAWLDLEATAYTAHPYRNPVIGWKADMEKYSTRDAVDFHTRYYNPTNAVCVLVGDVTAEQARSLAEIYFGRYPAGERSPAFVTREPPQEGFRASVRYLKGARTPLVRIGFHGARMGTDDFYALDALTMVLSHGRGARLTQRILNRGLAVEAWAYNPDNRYGGMVVLGGSPVEPQTLRDPSIGDAERKAAYLEACREMEALLLSEVEKLKSETVSERELDRIKKLNRREFMDRMRSNESLAGTLATLEVQIGWRYLTQYLQRLEAVTADQIRQAARDYLGEDNKTSVYVIPGDQPDRPPASYTEVRSLSGASATRAARGNVTENHSVYPTPVGWKHPLSFDRTPHKIEYPAADRFAVSGAEVFYLADNELPLIDLTLLVKAGEVDLPPEMEGLTNVLNGTLVDGGTDLYPPAELATLLDESGIQIGFAAEEEMSTVRLSVLKSDWRKGLEMLREVLLRPAFDPRVLDAVKQQAVTALQRQAGDAQSVAARESRIWHFKGHPYGRDPLKGLTTIPAIGPEDLKSFLKSYFVPANMTVAVSGDIDRSAVADGLAEFFDAFPKTDPPERNLPAPPATPPVLAMVHKPGQVQSQVVITLPSVPRTDPDYWKIGLLADLFGGSDSLLYRRLRDDLGLVYATYFYQSYKWKTGLLNGYIGCKGDQTGVALAETAAIMEKLQQNIPADELQQKRLDILNSFVFNVDTKADLVEVYGRYALRNEPLDTLERIQEAYFSTGREKLRQLADTYLTPRKMQIFVVGDKTINTQKEDGRRVTLEAELKEIAARLGLTYSEILLR
jgi:predicted Zn-dependent peptidase